MYIQQDVSHWTSVNLFAYSKLSNDYCSLSQMDNDSISGLLEEGGCSHSPVLDDCPGALCEECPGMRALVKVPLARFALRHSQQEIINSLPVKKEKKNPHTNNVTLRVWPLFVVGKFQWKQL